MSILRRLTDAIRRRKLAKRAYQTGTVNLSPDEGFDLLFELIEGGYSAWLVDDMGAKAMLMNRSEDKLRDFYHHTAVMGYRVNIIERFQ